MPPLAIRNVFWLTALGRRSRAVEQTWTAPAAIGEGFPFVVLGVSLLSCFWA